MIHDWPPTGFVLSELVLDARVKAARAQPDPARGFEATFGRVFFVRFTGSFKARLPAIATPALGLVPGIESETTGETLVIIHPLARRAGSEHPFISIGRVDKNDVCLADETVSKFHAYVKETQGVYALQDARSRNGTTLDGVTVPGRGLGDPLTLKSGQSIRFGGVDGAFLDAKSTFELLTRMSKG